MVLMFVFPSDSYVDSINTSVMVVGGGAFERCLSHERRALMNGITILLERPQGEPGPFHPVRTQGEDSRYDSGRQSSSKSLTVLVP